MNIEGMLQYMVCKQAQQTMLLAEMLDPHTKKSKATSYSQCKAVFLVYFTQKWMVLKS